MGVQLVQSTPQRIVIVGTTGAGKTTLACQLAQRLNLPHVELDSLHWEPNWVEAEPTVFQARVEQALQGDRWVVDGNYSLVRHLTWQQADTLVWLDYSLVRILKQLLGRTLHRVITQTPVCNGNRETFRLAFLSSDSILLWALRTYHQRRRQYPSLLQQPEFAHLKVVRLSNPQETQTWLAQFGSITIVD